MLKVTFVILCLLFATNLLSQNLVANGGFEDRNICTEYDALCAPEAWFFIPRYVKMSPRIDSNHVEIIHAGRAGNFMYTKLLCPLVAGQQYYFSVWVYKASKSFNTLGIWLSNTEPGLRGFDIGEPSVTITAKKSDSVRGNWRKLTDTFTAKGTERFLMIGGTTSYSKSYYLNPQSLLYYVDNLSLTSALPSFTTCPEYNTILKQVYDLNDRHPAGFIESIPVEIEKKDTVEVKKTIEWVIVDTPPSMKKRVADTLIIPDVLFEFTSSKLNPAFSKKLDSLIKKIVGLKYKKLQVVGHTDNVGKPAYNLGLSLARAQTIRDYIIEKLLVDKDMFEVKGEGERKPVSTNKTSEGRQRNRRVEIIIHY